MATLTTRFVTARCEEFGRFRHDRLVRPSRFAIEGLFIANLATPAARGVVEPPSYEAGASVPNVTSGAANPGQAGIGPGFPLLSAAPVIVFLIVNRLGGLRWAVVLATIASVIVVVDRRRRGSSLGKFMPIVTVAVLVRGAVGAITNSEGLYFGLGIAAKYAIGAGLCISVLIGQPLGARAMPYVLDLPRGVREHPEAVKTARDITSIAGVYYLLSASFDLWLFGRSSIEGFVVVRFIANWPLTAAALLVALNVANARFSRIPDIAPLPTLLEQRLAARSPVKPPKPPGSAP